MSPDVGGVQDMDVSFFSLQYHQMKYSHQKQHLPSGGLFIVCVFLQQVHCQVLESLVVRISACHVEGPGSIPGRGG